MLKITLHVCLGRNLLITRSNINGDTIPPDQQSILFLISFILRTGGVQEHLPISTLPTLGTLSWKSSIKLYVPYIFVWYVYCYVELINLLSSAGAILWCCLVWLSVLVFAFSRLI